MTSSLRRVAACCALALASTTLAVPALADDIDLGPEQSAPVTGIAWDERTDEVLSVGEDGKIVAVDAESGSRRSVSFTGPVQSVQALSLFDDLLYIADSGDPESSRDMITVYRVDPAADATNYRAWDFTYPGGARNSKAVAVSGKGRIYVVTDGEDPGIYRAAPQPSRTGVNKLVRAANAPAGVTDAVFLDDGSTLMMRTDEGVELLDGFSWEPRGVTTYVDGPPDESLSTFGESRMLVGDGTRLRDEPLPDGRTTVTPRASAPPTPSPTPSPETTGAPEPGSPMTTVVEVEVTEGVSRRGTILALAGAAIVAVLAGVVVFVVRD